VLGELVDAHFGRRDLCAVFPGYIPDPKTFPGLIVS